MTFLPEKPKEIFKSIGSIISPILFILAVIADSISVFEEYEFIFKVLLIISGIFTLGYGAYYIFFIRKVNSQEAQFQEQLQEKCKEINSLKEKINLLEEEICKGNKYIKNEASVTMDIELKKYKIKIQKDYEIISSNRKWFECQFYCNNKLTNAPAALEFYDKNSVTMDELNFHAFLQYSNISEDAVPSSQLREVFLKLVAEGSNYKQIHIEYKTIDGDTLDIRKGTFVRLIYHYEVPVTKWGSYLNRYISYWGEETKISVICKNKQRLERSNLKLYKTDDGGHPVIDDDSSWVDAQKDGLYCRELTINSKSSCCKYIVSWDAEVLFDSTDLNTKIGEDELHLTPY